tara:strand:- start:3154 stop:5064 length:1911 start_codon:yes stop_codon:yes gene_type:complete
MPTNVVCISPECETLLPPGKTKYCSKTCYYRESKRKARYKAQGRDYEPDVKEVNKGKVTQVRRGALYDKFVNEGYAMDLIQERLTRNQIAEELKCTPAHISRLLGAFEEDARKDKQSAEWEISDDAKQSLDDFTDFRDRYFLTEQGIPFETADFHENWIKSINKALLHGSQQMILSPPRHGKTELLIHFVIWLICRNPNIRIMWVGGNEDIAMNSVMSVMDTLEQNDKLKEDFCGPNGTFKPATRAGKMWSRNGFTVSTRTVSGIKSPTMIGIGRGGKILSRDCDIIIADDIEDHSSTMQPSSRNNTKNWWTTTLGSRKEEHTAMLVIGSRQHPEDLYSALLESEAWETIVEEAHDSLCIVPEFDEEDHVDCMLWSGKRSFKWLMDRKRDAMTTGGLKNFEMVYLNKAYNDSLSLFNPESIEKCYKPSMPLGTVPEGAYLVAGLDPAATGYQAGFLWAVETGEKIKLTMVDLENHHGGGLDEAFALIRNWHEKYNCYHWVIEENGFQKAIRQDKRIKEYCNVQGIKLEGHETHKNKWDEKFGVTSLAPMFNEEMISLPFYGGDAQAKSITYQKQLVYFASKGSGGRGFKSDVVMASWFPMKVVRTLSRLSYADLSYEYSPSYEKYDTIDWNELPWS